MTDEQNGRINRVRVEALEADVAEIKKELAENRALLYKTREETKEQIASLKAEMRIFSVIILGAISTLIAIVLAGVLSTG